MSATPIFNPLTTNGKFYEFQNALDDMLRVHSDPNLRMTPSKFLCLNLPSITDSQLSAYLSSFNKNASLTSIGTTPNDIIPNILYRYVENQNVLFKSNEGVNFYNSACEPILWKTLSLINLINFNENEDVVIEDTTSTVVYCGDIQCLNVMNFDNQEYLETYIHVPTQAGKIENAQWKQTAAESFSNTTLTYEESGNVDGIIFGRYLAGDSKEYYGLYDKGGVTTYEYVKGYGVDESWGVGIDFDFNTFTTSDTTNFNFNAIVVYYDLYRSTDNTYMARNIMGIYFVNEWEHTGTTWSIDPVKKYVPNVNSENGVPLTGDLGNAFGMRLLMKFSTTQNQTYPEIVVNAYNDISMELYMKSLQNLVDVNSNVNTIRELLSSIQAQVTGFQTLLSYLTTISSLQTKVQNIENLLSTYTTNNVLNITNVALLDAFTNTVNQLNESTGNTVNINIDASITEAQAIINNLNTTFLKVFSKLSLTTANDSEFINSLETLSIDNGIYNISFYNDSQCPETWFMIDNSNLSGTLIVYGDANFKTQMYYRGDNTYLRQWDAEEELYTTFIGN